MANALREKYDEVTLMKYIQQVSDEDRYKKRPGQKINSGGREENPKESQLVSQLLERGNQISFGPSNFLKSSQDFAQDQ